MIADETQARILHMTNWTVNTVLESRYDGKSDKYKALVGEAWRHFPTGGGRTRDLLLFGNWAGQLIHVTVLDPEGSLTHLDETNDAYCDLDEKERKLKWQLDGHQAFSALAISPELRDTLVVTHACSGQVHVFPLDGSVRVVGGPHAAVITFSTVAYENWMPRRREQLRLAMQTYLSSWTGEDVEVTSCDGQPDAQCMRVKAEAEGVHAIASGLAMWSLPARLNTFLDFHGLNPIIISNVDVACAEQYRVDASKYCIQGCPAHAFQELPDGLCECDEGYTGDGTSACAACPRGKYKAGRGSGACQSCESSTYQDSAGAAVCHSCPPNSESQAESSAVTDCRCLPGFDGFDGAPCIACTPGTSKSIAGRTPSDPTEACADGTPDVIFSDRVVGCDTQWEAPGLMSGADACSAGWSLCASEAAARTNGMTAAACASLAPEGTFYASQASGPGKVWRCSEEHPGQSDGFDNIFGCGNNSPNFQISKELGIHSCGVFTNAIGNSDTGTWTNIQGVANSEQEFMSVIKVGVQNGGVLCCKDPCTPCAADTFADGHSELCAACPAHSQSPPASDALSDCICNAGYSGPDGGPCLACQAGTYKEGPGNDGCVGCPSGTFSTVLAGDSPAVCVACPDKSWTVVWSGARNVSACQCNPGFTGADGGPCEACVPGSFKEERGAGSCETCGPNTYSAMTGSTSAGACRACPANSVSPPGSGNVMQCRCLAGYVGADGDACTPCGPGTFKGNIGDGTCSACPANTWSATVGAVDDTVCVSCPEHASAPGGSTCIEDCSCLEGYTGANGAECVACLPGKYKESAGSETCVACPRGTFSGVLGAVSASTCEACPANSGSAEGSNRCTCLAGFYGPPGGPCIECPEGSYCAGGSLEDCPAHTSSPLRSSVVTNCSCIAGYVGPDGGSCDLCWVGFFCPGGMKSYICKQHSSSPAGSTQAANCVCNPGYKSMTDGGECELCPVGQFCNGGTAVSCPSNALAPAGSSSSVHCICKPGWYGPVGGDQCTRCPANSYCEGGNSVVSCPGELSLCLASRTSRYSPILYRVWAVVPLQLIFVALLAANSDSPAQSMAAEDCTCLAGYYGPPGGPCTLCEAGYWCMRGPHRGPCRDFSVSLEGATFAQACICIGGFYSDSFDVCAPCPGDHWCANGLINPCPDNSWSPESSNAETDCRCKAGFGGPDGGPCLACPAGTFKHGLGSGGCIPCPEGTYSSSLSAISNLSCAVCPASSTSREGSDSVSDCKCLEGHSGSDWTSCAVCEAGTYKPDSGFGDCTHCPKNYFATILGATSPETCQACPLNTISPEGSSSAESCLCAKGYSGPNGGPCIACPTGTFKAHEGIGECQSCAVGTYSNIVGGTTPAACLPCPEHTNTTRPGSVDKNACICDSAFDGAGGSACLPCPGGRAKAARGHGESDPAGACADGSSEVVFSDRVVGCDASWDHPGVAGAEGVCGSGWEICTSERAAKANGLTQESCGTLPAEGTFYATYESGPGRRWICHEDGPGQSDGFNDIYGCGKSSANFQITREPPHLLCGVLTRAIGNKDIGSWTNMEGTNSFMESAVVQKVEGNGGVLCCKTPCEVCGHGTYSLGAVPTCSQCPLHTNAPISSDERADCTCNAGYVGNNGGPCEACPAGTYKEIAGGIEPPACEAGPADVVFTDRVVGCNAAWTSPGVTNGASACAEGWHICRSHLDAAANGLTREACSSLPSQGTFYATLESGPGGAWSCSDAFPGPSDGFNDIFGCGKSSWDFQMSQQGTSITCGSLTAALGNKDVGLWSNMTGENAFRESAAVVKHGLANGGVMCCKNAGVTDKEFFNNYGFGLCVECEPGSYSDVGSVACTRCPANTKSPRGSSDIGNCTCLPGFAGSDGAACSACLPGYYKEAVGAGGCSSCAEGKYSRVTAATNQDTCLLCPPHAISLPASSSIYECVCDAGSSGPNGGPCEACAPGTYKEDPGAASCTNCPEGTYTDMDGAVALSNCSSCPQHCTSMRGSGSLTDCFCESGFRGPFGGPCEVCPAGSWCKAGVAHACSPDRWAPEGSGEQSDCACKPGYWGESGGICKLCQRDSYCPGGNESVTCPEGTSAPGGQIAIENCSCSAATFGPNGGPCQICPAGSYCEGGTLSKSCPAHATSAAGADDASDCACIAGYSAGASKLLLCEACVAGKFKESAGPAPCMQCGSGSYSRAGATVCETCPFESTSERSSDDVRDCICKPGYYGQNGTACQGCPAGTYKRGSGSGPCTSCPAGKFSVLVGSKLPGACRRCPTATDSSTGADAETGCTCNAGFTGSDGGPCQACEAGTYKAERGSAPCTVCQSNSQSAAGSIAQTNCVCISGYVGELGGPCSVCPANSYCVGGIATSCPEFSTSPSGSNALTDCVCSAGYFGPDGGPCEKCPANQYCLGGTDVADCPDDSLSGVGSAQQSDCVCQSGYEGSAGGPCTQCPSGSYCNGGVVIDCPQNSVAPAGSTTVSDCVCNAGFHGSNSCNECPAGEYCSGGSSKVACPDNTNSPIGSYSVTSCVCNAGYSGPNGGPCAVCLAGTFKISGSGSCNNCSAGSYNSEIGGASSDDCSICPLNSVSQPGSSAVTDCVAKAGHEGANGEAATACVAGTYKSVEGSGQCLACMGGTFSTTIAATNASTCLYCPENADSPAGAGALSECICIDGFEGAPGGPCSICPGPGYCTNGTMVVCSSNSRAPEGSENLLQCECESGYSGPSGGPCDECVSSFFCPGGTANASCPMYSYSAPGSSAISDCICKPGYQGPPGGPCVPCPLGDWCFEGGVNDCPEHSSAASLAWKVTDCHCKPGFFGPAGGSCAICSLNHYCVGGTESASCPAQSSSPQGSDHKSACVCLDGYYGEAGETCSVCNPGHWCKDGQENSCPPNSVSPTASISQNNCTCNGGFKATPDSACLRCPSGEWCSDGISYRCPDHSTSTELSDIATNCTCHPGYTGQNGQECIECPAGTFKAEDGSAVCTECQPGTYSETIGAVDASTCISCPALSNSSSGARSRNTCQCIPGYTGQHGSECTPCTEGTYKDAPGSGECLSCMPDKFSGSVAATSALTCLSCPSNSHGELGNVQLADCKCDEGFIGDDGQECSACYPGTYKDVRGTGTCVNCPAKTYSDMLGARSLAACHSCPDNADSPHGSTAIGNCSCMAGYTGNASDGDPCSACPAGSYKETSGDGACLLCPDDSYSGTIAANSSAFCMLCPGNASAPKGSTIATDCRCKPGFIGEDGNECLACGECLSLGTNLPSLK